MTKYNLYRLWTCVMDYKYISYMNQFYKNIYYHEHFHKGENIIFLEDRDETLLHVPGNGCVEIIVHVTGNTERVIVLCRRRRI